jgi:hypothetical protein
MDHGMNANLAAPVQDRMVHITKSDARRARAAIPKMCPPVGEPVDFEDCVLLGVWLRLGDGERTFPTDLWSGVQARIERGIRSLGARDRSPSRILGPDDLRELVEAVMHHHVAVMAGDQDPWLDRSEAALIVDEGLISAIFGGRCYYAGKPLMDVLAERRRGVPRALEPKSCRSRLATFTKA